MTPPKTPPKTAAWAGMALMGGAAIAALAAGFFVLTQPQTAGTPVASHGSSVGIGDLLEGARSDESSEALLTAARLRARAALPGAPDVVLALAADLSMGNPIDTDQWAALDSNLYSFVFRPNNGDAGGGSLAREAVALGRMDALAAMVEGGMPTYADGDLAFWSALEMWTPERATFGRVVLAKAALEADGVNRVHEEGFTGFEMAATVSLDAVVAMVENGGNPWKHPLDWEEDHGFPSVMERLSLHAGEPGALDILEGMVAIDTLPMPSERALWNTVGNLIDNAKENFDTGNVDTARRMAKTGRGIEERFGKVPDTFWNAEVANLATEESAKKGLVSIEPQHP